MQALQKTFALVLAFFTGLFSSIGLYFNDMVNDYSFSVDTAVLGDALPNLKSNVNCYGGRFSEYPAINAEENPYDFIKYVQLMECSGGNADRDLFRDPADFSVLDDYDFSALIASCRGILKTGAKPLLKLGNVPEKLSQKQIAENESLRVFNVNVFPPDDYGQYYEYIKAIAEALVAEFTLPEVQSWRFGVLTEFENKDWFYTPGQDPVQSMAAYCKLYDYTVQALTDVLGNDVFVGAHAMGCSEGLWDKRLFIRHCGIGKNFANGGTGTPLKYISVSYYERTPGNDGGLYLPDVIAPLRKAAENVGLTDLIYGVDEGRILCGLRSGRDSDQLPSRTVGFTYQAGFDARLAKLSYDCGLNYFSSWGYCSNEFSGIPTITYHVAKHAAQFAGARRAAVTTEKAGRIKNAEVEAVAAFDEEANTLRIMAYNYKNDLNYPYAADLTLNVHVPQLADGEVSVTLYRVNDDCNWFDEWEADRQTYGITDNMFSWSPDDGQLTFVNSEAAALYRSELTPKYAACARLTPETTKATVKDGCLTLTLTLEPNAVAFYEISQ